MCVLRVSIRAAIGGHSAQLCRWMCNAGGEKNGQQECPSTWTFIVNWRAMRLILERKLLRIFWVYRCGKWIGSGRVNVLWLYGDIFAILNLTTRLYLLVSVYEIFALRVHNMVKMKVIYLSLCQLTKNLYDETLLLIFHNFIRSLILFSKFLN